VIYQTTPAEKEAIQKVGQTPADEYVYCRPCANLLRDKEKGAALMRGLVAARLRVAGDPRADAIAQKMYDFLIRKGRLVS
jgi:hypothetical protein